MVPYAVVRHPMYAAELPLLVGTPLALASWRGLGTLFFFMPALLLGGFWTRKDSCERICRDILSIPGKCGIDWCRFSGRSKKNE